MATSLLKQSIRNSFYLNVGSGSSAIIALLFAGFRIRFLGVEASGFLMLLESVTSMSTSFGGFGFGTAALRKIAVYNGQKKFKEMRLTLGAVLFVDVIVGLIVATVVVIGFSWIFKWSRTSELLFTDAYTATIFIGMALVLRQLVKTYGVVFSALQRYDITALINTIFGLLTGGIGIITLMVLPTMTALAIVTFLLVLIHACVNIVMVRKLIGGAVFPRWNFKELRSMASFGGWAYFGTLSSMLVNGADRIILTTFLGSQSLPYYVIGQRVVTQVHTFLAGQSQFLFPMLASQGERIKDVVHNIEDRLRWFVAAISSIAYGGLALVAYPLLTMLVGEDFAKIALIPFLIACLQGFFVSLNIVSYHISWAGGHGAPNAVISAITGLLVAGTTVLLTPKYGIVGASIAQLWVGITSFALIYWVARLNGKTYWWGMLRPLISPVIMLLILFFGSMITLRMFQSSDMVQFLMISISVLCALIVGFYIENIIFRDYRCIETAKRVIGLILKRVSVIQQEVQFRCRRYL